LVFALFIATLVAMSESTRSAETPRILFSVPPKPLVCSECQAFAEWGPIFERAAAGRSPYRRYSWPSQQAFTAALQKEFGWATRQGRGKRAAWLKTEGRRAQARGSVPPSERKSGRPPAAASMEEAALCLPVAVFVDHIREQKRPWAHVEGAPEWVRAVASDIVLARDAVGKNWLAQRKAVIQKAVARIVGVSPDTVERRLRLFWEWRQGEGRRRKPAGRRVTD
jgi:hypothetical protein